MDSPTRAPAFTHKPTTRAGYLISVKIDSHPHTPFAKSPRSTPVIGQNNPLNCPQKSVVNNTSQLAIDHWHELITNSTVADAICDRLVHNAHRITLKGDSMRKTKNRLT